MDLWWYHFYYAMHTYGYHHFEAEFYADKKTGGDFSTLSLPPQDGTSIAKSCYVPIEKVFPDTQKE